jgi:hypothetical protein
MKEIYIKKRLMKYCRNYTEIENYEEALKDDFHGWICHHRLELTLYGEFAHTPQELERLGMYYNRPAFELIFLRRKEHQAIHNKGNKGHFSQSRRKNMSTSIKRVMNNPETKKVYDKNRYRFPKGNYMGKLR